MSYAQEKKISVDYIVEYLIPNKRQATIDTVKIGLDKSGRYIWTDSEYLAKDLAKSMFSGKENMMKNSELAIILDTKNMSVMLFFNSGENEMYMNMSLYNFFPVSGSSDAESFELISENTNEKVSVADREGIVYNIYPSNETSEKIAVVFDESIDVNNNKLFNNFFKLVFAAEGGSVLNDLELPNGLILNISNKGETFVEAIKIQTERKTFTINHSFKITE